MVLFEGVCVSLKECVFVCFFVCLVVCLVVLFVCLCGGFVCLFV